MKSVNDFNINLSDIPYYETGAGFYRYQPVYYTGIPVATHTQNGVTETVNRPFQTGYYYCLQNISGDDAYFYTRPDAEGGKRYWTQEWFYTPTYGSTVSFQSNLYSIYFGDNYLYNAARNTNSLTLKAQLNFDGVTDLEAKSIVHFYESNALLSEENPSEGQKIINLSLFPPYSRRVPGYIENVNTNYIYANSNKVTVNFDSPFLSTTYWDGLLIPNTSDQIYKTDKEYRRHDYVYLTEGGANLIKSWYMTGIYSFGARYPYESSEFTKQFYFKPDMSNSVDTKSRNYKNLLDKFYLYQLDGNNANLLVLDLKFNNRSDKEAKALLHYLEEHQGKDVFEFGGVPNFTGIKNFVCPNWSHTYNFKNNNTISANFIEVVYGLPDPPIFNVESFTDYNIEGPVYTPEDGFDFGYVPSGFAVSKDLYFVNSGSDVITFTAVDNQDVSTYKIFDKKSDKYIDIFDHGQENLIENEFPPGSSGVITFTYYLTDIEYTAEDIAEELVPVISGPFRYRSELPLKQYAIKFGDRGPDVIIELTGRSDAIQTDNPSTYFATGPNSSWLGFPNYVQAYPSYDYDTDVLSTELYWRPPPTGYFFERFSYEMSEQDDFAAATGSTVDVERLDPSIVDGIYGNLSGLNHSYEATINNVEQLRTYYIRVRGENITYSASSQNTYATGGYGIIDSLTNPEVISGWTPDPIPLNWGRHVENIVVYNTNLYNVDIFDVIRQNGTFRDRLHYYSGVNVIFLNGTVIGSAGPDNTHTGALIITGDYTDIDDGLTIFLQNTAVIGAAGRSDSDGNCAIYINASGSIDFNVNSSTVIAGGGGGGISLPSGSFYKFFTPIREGLETPVTEENRFSFARTYEQGEQADDITRFNQLFGMSSSSIDTRLKNTGHFQNVFFGTLEDPKFQIYGGFGAGTFNPQDEIIDTIQYSYPSQIFDGSAVDNIDTKIFVEAPTSQFGSEGYSLAVPFLLQDNFYIQAQSKSESSTVVSDL